MQHYYCNEQSNLFTVVIDISLCVTEGLCAIVPEVH